MNLTPENKKLIDSLSLESLLHRWRFAAAGDERFQGETGTYWAKRMNELRALPGGQAEWVSASKSIGWGPLG